MMAADPTTVRTLCRCTAGCDLITLDGRREDPKPGLLQPPPTDFSHSAHHPAISVKEEGENAPVSWNRFVVLALPQSSSSSCFGAVDGVVERGEFVGTSVLVAEATMTFSAPPLSQLAVVAVGSSIVDAETGDLCD